MKFPAILAVMIPFALTTQGAANEAIELITMDQLNYETTPEGVAFARLDGDRFTSEYMAMVRLPAGISSPPHVKSANMYGIVISGTMVHVPAGLEPKDGQRLDTGSFYKIPKGMPHISQCISNIECVTFLYQDGKFDFLPTAQ